MQSRGSIRVDNKIESPSPCISARFPEKNFCLSYGRNCVSPQRNSRKNFKKILKELVFGAIFEPGGGLDPCLLA